MSENDEARKLIIDLRGGVSSKCDFCLKPTLPVQLEPEEAGAWVCWECLEKWKLAEKAEESRGK